MDRKRFSANCPTACYCRSSGAKNEKYCQLSRIRQARRARLRLQSILAVRRGLRSEDEQTVASLFATQRGWALAVARPRRRHRSLRRLQPGPPRQLVVSSRGALAWLNRTGRRLELGATGATAVPGITVRRSSVRDRSSLQRQHCDSSKSHTAQGTRPPQAGVGRSPLRIASWQGVPEHERRSR